MFFRTTKRGRPKTIKHKIDLGTPELQLKQKQMLTIEPLDLCFQQKLITSEQHHAGIKYRCLYSKKMGAATIQSNHWQNTGYTTNKQISNQDYEENQKQLLQAINTLKSVDSLSITSNICIHHMMYTFIQNRSNRCYHYKLFNDGLTRLVKLFNIEKKQKKQNENHCRLI